MKKIIVLLTTSLFATLFIGYYNSIEDAEIHSHFFIKKKPTLQIKFFNIFANNADSKKLYQLTEQERKRVIDYCAYRLGIETTLKTQNELEACEKR